MTREDSDEMIYVGLLDEGIEVWRPVRARRLAADACLIIDQPYERDIEKRAFDPGSVVRCRFERRDGREVTLACVRVA